MNKEQNLMSLIEMHDQINDIKTEFSTEETAKPICSCWKNLETNLTIGLILILRIFTFWKDCTAISNTKKLVYEPLSKTTENTVPQKIRQSYG